jgi:lactate dehydrogenase-like 2-hydroxyacid dehydrogenase
MNPWTVIVTEPEYKKAEASFAAAADLRLAVCGPAESEVSAAVRSHAARAVIVGVERYAGPLYGVLPRGGVIARFGVGHDGIDKTQATAAGLLVTNTPGVLEDAVAEHALALLLAVSRNLAACVRSMDCQAWTPRQGTELRGRTLAVIGCGAIGRRVARAASLGFGMRVVGLEPRLDSAEELRTQWGFQHVTNDFGEAVRDADVVSLHLPANAATHHLIAAQTIAQMRPGAILINTARGAVVDEVALYDALATGRLAAAGLDVFEVEPYVPRQQQKDLRTLANAMLTPHVSSSTREACARVAEACLANLRSARDGRYGAVNLLNPEVLGHVG